MSRNIAVGIDVGSHHVKVVVSELSPEKGVLPTIIGTGHAESKGLRHGYIINGADVTESVKIALAEAEKQSKIKIKKTFLSVGGVGVEAVIGVGRAVVSRGDGEITALDIEKSTEQAKVSLPKPLILNRDVLHAIPLSYKVDGKEIPGKSPMGMKGLQIDARVIFITCLSQHLKDLIDAVEDAGVDVQEVVAAPLAASQVNTTKAQKVAGCVLANIGAETVSVVVFENNLPISLEVFPIGSTDVTHNIALALRISLEEAESIKLGAVTNTQYAKRDLDKIVDGRLSDMFELIEAHLKKIGRNGLLPAGVILTGGGAGIHTIEDFARSTLRLPARIGSLPLNDAGKPIKDASWSVAYGLTIIALLGGFNDDDSSGSSSMKGPIFDLLKALRRWLANAIKPFLP